MPHPIIARLSGALALLLAPACLPAFTIEQVVSRENPSFNNLTASLTVGRDGRAYLTNSTAPGHLMRLELDGSKKVSAAVVYATHNATASREGTIAVASGHFAHKVTIYDSAVAQKADYRDFLVSDKVGWDAPAHVEAGDSGDFYAVDQHRNRIVRLSAGGAVLSTHNISRDPPGPAGAAASFRVHEGLKRFYTLTREGRLRCETFDGIPLWSLRLSGPFDIDDRGDVWTADSNTGAVRIFSADGQPLRQMKIDYGDGAPSAGMPLTALRIHGGNLILRRRHPTEIFRRYDLASGRPVNVVVAAHERLSMTCAQDVWPAGGSVVVDVRHDAAGRAAGPRWRLWLRPMDGAGWRELALRDGTVAVPEDCAGVYHLKLSPQTDGAYRPPGPEYLLQGWVEIRTPGARGTFSTLTPGGRRHYARGETVPWKVIVRPEPRQALAATLELVHDGRPVVSREITVAPGREASGALPAALTEALAPGEYALVARAAGHTCVPQHLHIGGALRPVDFHTVAYGDYRTTYPSATPWTVADVIGAHVNRISLVGFNLMADRLGDPLQAGALSWDGAARGVLEELAKRLSGDATGTAPEKAAMAPPLAQTLAAYGTAGVQQMAILMRNDAGLPPGSGYDKRAPEELTRTITSVTTALRGYPAFRGWSWASNWWVFEQRGSRAAKNAEERGRYEAALKRALDTGQWDPILERVAGYRLAHAPEAQELFRRTLRQIAPELVCASAAPFRNVDAWPPVTLANVDEVDLQAQWEQIAVPLHAPWNVDFYKRPGRRAWAHPEVWNDAGTGDQIIPTMFMLAMRGADGAGSSDGVPRWGNFPDDPRTCASGLPSVMRAANTVLRWYGPLAAATENDDPVALLASRRMFLIDQWGAGVMGTHFARLFEAYLACLAAHRPARVVFSDDLTAGALRGFRAVLLVDQRVELEPETVAALNDARAAGVPVFHDGTCRRELVARFMPLGTAFDRIEKDPNPAGDDSACVRFREAVRSHLPAVRRAMAMVPPLADVSSDQILLSRRRSGRGRYLFAVNNTLHDLDPAHMWRTTLYVTSLVPVATTAAVDDAPAIYDVLAMRRAAVQDGRIVVDLRNVPGRIFAMLPAPVGAVALRACSSVSAGQSTLWEAQVVDAAGRAIDAAVPLRLRLVDPRGQAIDEQFLVVGPAGRQGAVRVPLNAPPGRCTLEAVELVGGACAAVQIEVAPAPLPLTMTDDEYRPPARRPADTAGARAEADISPAEELFGPHVRDLVLSPDGTMAMASTMNWDLNLHGLDAATGRVLWSAKAGQYFAFAPEALEGGFAVQGFDFTAVEGYHLYLLDRAGRAERRFALYGVPKRLPHRFVPAIVRDSINNFACAPDGRWVASSGDLGLCVWDREGRLLWSHDWWKESRHWAKLAALGDKALLAVTGGAAVALGAGDGKVLWRVELPAAGDIRLVRLSRDRETAAIVSSADGGRVFVVRQGVLAGNFLSAALDAALSPDGRLLVVTAGAQVKCYGVDSGLMWVAGGDDVMRYPRFAPDGRRIAVCSELGTLHVFDESGKLVHRQDLGALAVPAFAPDGHLLAGTWMGRVLRLDEMYRQRWVARLPPAEAGSYTGRLIADAAPTARPTKWGNALPEAMPIRPNLLEQAKAKISFVPSGTWGGQARFIHDAGLLVDGRADPPPTPWLAWDKVGFFAETSPNNYILMDAGQTQMRVTAITLFEDPSRPESFLRDAVLEWWDADRQQWETAAPLLSDAAVHSHALARPVVSTRFRIALPWGVVGNLRLGEIVLHGELLPAQR